MILGRYYDPKTRVFLLLPTNDVAKLQLFRVWKNELCLTLAYFCITNSEYLLGDCYMADTVAGTGNSVGNEPCKVSALRQLMFKYSELQGGM
jgi:hypothetical protein